MSKKTVREANALNQRVQADTDAFRKPQVLPTTNAGKTAAADSMPAQYFDHNNGARKVAVAQKYAQDLVQEFAGNAQNHVHPSVSYSPTKEEIDLVLQRENELQVAAFEKFIRDRFNVNDPHDARIIRELWPTYFEKRLKEVDNHLEIQRRIARIKLMGVLTTEDLMFLYAIASQKIKIPTTPAFNLAADAEQRLQRGMLNPRRRVGIPTGDSLWNTFDSQGDRLLELLGPGAATKGNIDVANALAGYGNQSNTAKELFQNFTNPGDVVGRRHNWLA
jgi:hypothetical protein